MGKKTGPSPEELEFIFECFSRGLSDREVLDEIQDTEFPVRNPRFMRDRRKEFTAARKILETTVKLQMNPAIVKAQEEHLEEVEGAIHSWWEEIGSTPTIEDFVIYSDQAHHPYASIFLEEGGMRSVMPTCLREHLPLVNLWENHSKWMTKLPEYEKKCSNIAYEIRQEGKKWVNVKILDQFEHPLLYLISAKQIARLPVLKNNPKESLPGYHGVEYYNKGTTLFANYEKRCWKISTYNNILTDRNILEAVNPLKYINTYEAMCKHYLDCAEVGDLIQLYLELNSYYSLVKDCLVETRTSKSYMVNTCRYCPSQQKTIV